MEDQCVNDQVKPLTSQTGSAGDIWRAWQVTLDGDIYYVQESRIGYQVLKQPVGGGRKNASAEEKQRVIAFLEASFRLTQ
jgi:hypothetical protein